MRWIFRVSALAFRIPSAIPATFAGGLFLLCWGHQAVARFGASTSAMSSILGVVLAAYFTARVLHRSTSLVTRHSKTRDLAIDIAHSLVLSLCAIFAVDLVALGWTASVSVLPQTLPTTIQQVGVIALGLFSSFFVGLVVVFWQFLKQVCVADSHVTVAGQATTRPPRFSWTIYWGILGATVAVLVISPKWGVHTTLFLGALCNVAVIALCLVRLKDSSNIRFEEPLVSIKSDHAIRSSGAQDEDRVHTIRFPVAKILSILTLSICGFLFIAAQRYLQQLMLQGSWVISLEWIIFAASAIAGWQYKSSRWLRFVGFVTVTCAISSLALFALLTYSMLDANSFVASVPTAALIRSAIIALTVVPIGLTVGSQLGQIDSCGSQEAVSVRRTLWWEASLSCLVIALIAAAWLIEVHPLSTWIAGLSLGLLVTLCGAMCLWPANAAQVNDLPTEARQNAKARILRTLAHTVRRPEITIACIACVCLPLAFDKYQPHRSAKLLFDTGVFMANQVEERRDILSHLDEARCIATSDSSSGTLTLWKRRGAQLQLRCSGLPVSSVSTNTNLCPAPSSEALRAILPLSLVDRIARVGIVRSGVGTTLEIARMFPIEQIDLIEPDRGQFEFVKRHVWKNLPTQPLADERVKFYHSDTQLALASMRGCFDVVLIDSGELSLARAAAETTREFIMTAAESATRDGLVSMRFQYVDLGPGAIKLFADTWNSVFQQTAAIESAPGEWLLLGTNRKSDLFSEKIVRRLKKEHARAALAQLGWDWATPLNLAVFTGDNFKSAFGSTKVLNTVANVRLTSWLPWEVMRWGRKYGEVMARLAKHGQRMKDLVGTAGNQEIALRLQELDKQQNFITEHPDEYWYYRGQLKKQLRERPRSKLVQVKGEKPVHKLHPEEQNRLDYFSALGRVARMRKPTIDALSAVEELTSPYDPMITFFMHEELAEFAKRSRETLFEQEAALRIHRAHFTSPRDRSVQSLTEAIKLLCDYPETIDSDVERADHIDALLQVLHQRWQNRGDIPPASSPIVMREIEMSISASEKALKVLKKMREIRNITTADWKARQLVIEKSLIRPLRTYRTILLSRR